MTTYKKMFWSIFFQNMFFFCSFTNDKNIFESFLFQTTSNDNVLPLYCWPIPNDVSIIFNAVKSSIHISIDSSLTKPPLFLPSLEVGKAFHFSTTIRLLLRMHLQQIQQRSMVQKFQWNIQVLLNFWIKAAAPKGSLLEESSWVGTSSQKGRQFIYCNSYNE